MSIQSVLLPVLFEVALVFVLLGFLAQSRMVAMKSGTREADIALSGEGFPTRARQIANSYSNQFEMPVLFLLAVLFAIVLHQAGFLFVALEWVFVALRAAHAYIHTTTNKVAVRGPIFLASAGVAAVMWFLIFIGVMVGGLT